MPDSQVSVPWVISVHENLVGVTDQGDQQNYSVYRIPTHIRMLKPDKYDRVVLPLGLYNRNLNEATPMDRLKLEVVSVVLKHLNVDPNGWNTFCSDVAAPPLCTPALGYFYCDPPRDSFITHGVVQSVLTIDAIFIAALHMISFTRSTTRKIYDELREIFSRGNVRCSILAYRSDIWSTFENQIPLFLIKNIVKKIMSEDVDEFLRRIVSEQLDTLGLPHAESTESNISFESCYHLLACLHTVVCTGIPSNPSREAGSFEHCCHGYSVGSVRKMLVKIVCHLWDFLCSFLDSPTKPTSGKHRSLPTVSELQKAGISVRGIRCGACGVQFVKSYLTATLYLPQIDFEDNTHRYLLNMCAYELMTPHRIKKEQRIAGYLRIMDDLINTVEDVQLLRRGRSPVITRNLLGEDKMIAEVFNNLMQNFSLEERDVADMKKVTDEIHAWYGMRWRHQLTNFIDAFVTAPWILVTFTAATLLLIATILQTVYSLVGYYKK